LLAVLSGFLSVWVNLGLQLAVRGSLVLESAEFMASGVSVSRVWVDWLLQFDYRKWDCAAILRVVGCLPVSVTNDGVFVTALVSLGSYLYPGVRLGVRCFVSTTSVILGTYCAWWILGLPFRRELTRVWIFIREAQWGLQCIF
jgi:hypothetical protein